MTTRNTQASVEVIQKYFVQPDGTYVGDYESMYLECEDPWLQMDEADHSPFGSLMIDRILHLPERRVLDIGCGIGALSNRIRIQSKATILGLDVSKTAIQSARKRFPECQFEVGQATEIDRLKPFAPTAIIMSGVTWCILKDFSKVLILLRANFPGALLFHLMTFYGADQQKYGREYFKEVEGLLPYFDQMTLVDSFEHRQYPNDGSSNSLLILKV